MKKLLTLALLALLIMQGCTDKDDPQPEQRKPRKEIYDRVEMEKVHRVG
ncbi:hypothetical protein ACS126_09920 [Sphingobacterium lactis]